ncbi:hypothetical protein PIB30_087217, partial [Stylosanthes scabra]|nr:hypothetical protein [Stylosanthes scabra]
SFFFLKFHSNESTQLDEATVRETLVSFHNDWKKAFDFFNWVESHHNFPHSTATYNSILDILAKYFEFDLCWDLIHLMRQNPHSQPNHATFRLMFNHYASAHAVDDALSTFHCLSQFNLKDLHSYSIYMDILCKSGKSWKAVKLYKNLKSQGIKLDVVVHNIVIHAIGLSRGVDFSIRVFNEMSQVW